jgi:hypothetical protein
LHFNVKLYVSHARFFGGDSESPGENSRDANERILMNTKFISKGLLLGTSLFFASAAFAGDKASVKFYEDVKLNGKTIAPGKYDVEIEGTGSQAQFSIRQGKETIATVPATVNPTKVAQPSTGYSTSQAQDGSKTLTAVLIAGKKYTIQLGQEEAAAPSKASEPAGNR